MNRFKRWFRRKKRARLKQRNVRAMEVRWLAVELKLQELRLFQEMQEQQVSEYIRRRTSFREYIS